jgi:hypothetical protein
MEFFNYEYCRKLNKHNELDKLNISISDIQKDIEIKKQNIKTILETYINHNCVTKLKMVNLKHIIIKYILDINNTNKLLKNEYEIINNIDKKITKYKSINYNLIMHLYTYVYDYKKIDYTRYKLFKYYKILEYDNTQTNIPSNMILLYNFIINNNVIELENNLKYIILNFKKIALKKNKKLYDFYYDNILYNKNTDNINHNIYKILNLHTLINLNKEIVIFNKIKSKNIYEIKILYNQKKKILKSYKIYMNCLYKLHRTINTKIKLYKKLYNMVYKKSNNIYNIIDKYEKNIANLNKLLETFNNKSIELKNEINNINPEEYPPELNKKCIKFNDQTHTCCICLEYISTGIQTSCHHIFHIYCINLYIYSIINTQLNEINIICPLCRKYI